MTTPDPGVYIPPAQMYQELRSLSDGLTRVETKLDGIGRGLVDVGKDVTDHEIRIRALEQGNTEAQKRDRGRLDSVERRVWAFAGGATVLGAGAGIVAQVLMH